MVERKFCLLGTWNTSKERMPTKFVETTDCVLWHFSPVAAATIEAGGEGTEEAWAEIMETAYYESQYDRTVYKLRMESDGLYAVAVSLE